MAYSKHVPRISYAKQRHRPDGAHTLVHILILKAIKRVAVTMVDPQGEPPGLLQGEHITGGKAFRRSY
eukprot:4867642-Pleurochrysis_carterae.AAC.1